MARDIARMTLVLLMTVAPSLFGQHIVLGGGLGVGTIPHALTPLCASAQRLNGAGLSARAGAGIGAVRATVALDYITTGSVVVADCVPKTGVHVDSLFRGADNSATTISGGASLPIASALQIGAEAGWVLQHSSWFIGPVVGAQYGWFRLEAVGRLHFISFDEITTDFGPPTVTELSRESRTKTSWGGAVRLMAVTR